MTSVRDALDGLDLPRSVPRADEVPAPPSPCPPAPGPASGWVPRPSNPTPLPLPTGPPAAAAPPAALTPDEQARLRTLPEATRQQVLAWLTLDDPICRQEARRLLAPPPPEPPPAALSTPDLLAGLPGRPDRVAAAAGRLCAELGDHRSFAFYDGVARAVCERRRPAAALVSAWRQGRHPKARNRGAVFATAWARESAPGASTCRPPSPGA